MVGRLCIVGGDEQTVGVDVVCVDQEWIVLRWWKCGEIECVEWIRLVSLVSAGGGGINGIVVLAVV